MKNAISKTLLVACMLLLVPVSFALTLQEAKSEGLIGEQRNGYVGLVVESAPAAVMALARDVNNQRRELYPLKRQLKQLQPGNIYKVHRVPG